MRWNLIWLALLALAVPAAAAEALPSNFVYLHDVAPAIAQDMRYATADNFTGHPLPGYNASECVLRRDAALALKRVAADLARQHLGLKTYDCYRPRRAVRAMLRWSRQPDDGTIQRFYPTLQKRQLFALGYIAYHSRHSTGIAVDLTLVPLLLPPVAAFDPHAHYGACTAPAAQRAPDDGLDMGTGFDCFDMKSRTRSPALTPAQKARRQLLVAAMRRRGFQNYFREWWHFEFAGPAPRRAYDFLIEPRPR
jgi:D-alanyl-D-alanine dipeptidase